MAKQAALKRFKKSPGRYLSETILSLFATLAIVLWIQPMALGLALVIVVALASAISAATGKGV